MAFIEDGYLFSNNQDVKGNNASTVSEVVSSKNNAPTNKDAWGGNKNAQIGGMTVVCVLTSANNLTGGNLTPSLMTHTANNLNAAGTVVAQLPVIAQNAVPYTTVKTKLPAGTERLKFLGMKYVCGGNVTEADVTCYMEGGEGQVID